MGDNKRAAQALSDVSVLLLDRRDDLYIAHAARKGRLPAFLVSYTPLASRRFAALVCSHNWIIPPSCALEGQLWTSRKLCARKQQRSIR